MSLISRAELINSLVGPILKPIPLTVEIVHESFVPGFTLIYDDNTEELEFAEALDWFKARGARNMEAVEKALVSAYNFPASHRRVFVTIDAPTRPAVTTPGGPAYSPNI